MANLRWTFDAREPKLELLSLSRCFDLLCFSHFACLSMSETTGIFMQSLPYFPPLHFYFDELLSKISNKIPPHTWYNPILNFIIYIPRIPHLFAGVWFPGSDSKTIAYVTFCWKGTNESFRNNCEETLKTWWRPIDFTCVIKEILQNLIDLLRIKNL